MIYQRDAVLYMPLPLIRRPQTTTAAVPCPPAANHMGSRQSNDSAGQNSSIALLQERFKKLQRVREMREEKELHRSRSQREEQQPKWLFPGASSAQPGGRRGQALDVDASPAGGANAQSSAVSGETDVDTSLHL